MDRASDRQFPSASPARVRNPQLRAPQPNWFRGPRADGCGVFSGSPEEGELLFRLTIGVRNADGGSVTCRPAPTALSGVRSVQRQFPHFTQKLNARDPDYSSRLTAPFVRYRKTDSTTTDPPLMRAAQPYWNLP